MKKFDWRRKPVKLAIFICCMIILSLLLNPSDTHRCLCSQWTTVFSQGQAEEEANMSQTTVPPSGGCQLCVSPDSTPSDLSQAQTFRHGSIVSQRTGWHFKGKFFKCQLLMSWHGIAYRTVQRFGLGMIYVSERSL